MIVDTLYSDNLEIESMMDRITIDEDSRVRVAGTHNDDQSSPSDRLVESSPSSDRYRSTFIYVISNQVYADKNMFKIGKHTGSKKGLLRRYKTYLIDPILYILFPTGAQSQDESILLSRLSKYRIGTSEFVQLSLDQITSTIEGYFRSKYKRNPSVKFKYCKGLVCENVLLDLDEKTLQNEKCYFFPNFNFDRSDDCLDSVSIRWQNKEIFLIQIHYVHRFLEYLDYKESLIKEFMRCFFIQFDKQNSYLYLNSFVENGWTEFIQYTMEVLFSYNKCCKISRKDFLKKESFHERIIMIERDETPLEYVLTKAQQVECCLVIEDKNVYSIEDKEIDNSLLEHLIYYYLYIF
jgi:hypothetical protein